MGQRFDALVTGIGDGGTWVRIFEPSAEGRRTGDFPELKVGQLLRVRGATIRVSSPASQ
ncbi:hypothetical protein QU481_18295 [Crenobacter sp. SG2303]|uniref:RNase II-type exonuclease C-terminal S1 domain-containing protein n=1 Tax=Crenobacter oryzisoli TaxID=3056844 RepID=A0ABT7XRB0_9NEIS|nr:MULTISPECIES: hypothetical protein [unclassified Crenobacter]MDN0076316.1 hypothetical protein [Crenobacter sp. SG2303]MDN0076805.1 hypothetical protein [Crenobacter sp. SG2303]MDN0084645.1 hypothetical protein [Crenobacter sp. SG2305]